MPKILYFVTEDWFFVSHFLPMAQAARDCGLQVTVATRVREDGERLKAEGFSVIAIEGRRGSFSPWRGLRDFFQAFKIVRDQRADIVHCIALRPVVIGGLAAKLAGTGALVVAPTGLGHLWIEDGMAVRVARKIVRAIVGSWLRGPRTHYLFENRDDPREFGLDPDGADVTIVGGAGVDPAKFSRNEEPVAPPLKVAVVSRMIWPKGIVEAVEAVRQARRTGAPVELHLFGAPDPANPRSIPPATLEGWSAEPGITWHGRVDDVAQVWCQHHVAMLLSYREGLPRSLVEAAAAGRPIVATDVPGCREVARDGKEGILVPLGDSEAMAARALTRLAADQALRERLGAAANVRFHERFTAGAVRQTIQNLYRSLVPSP